MLEAMIGHRVLVTPQDNKEEGSFTGVLQQPLFHDDWYVRTDDGELCGPYADDDLSAPIRAGAVVEVRGGEIAIVVYNQGAKHGDPDPNYLMLWTFDPQDYSRIWPYNAVRADDVRALNEEGMKNLQASRPDYWLLSLNSEAEAIKARYGDSW